MIALLNNNDAPHTGQFINYIGNPMKVPVKVIKEHQENIGLRWLSGMAHLS